MINKKNFQKLISVTADWIVISSMIGFFAVFTYEFFKENQNSVVVTDMHIVNEFKYSDNVWSAEIMGNKIRKCIFVPDQVYGLVKVDNIWRESEFFFSNDSSPGSNRALGIQSFDTWNWKGSKNVSEVKVIVNHICNKDKIVETVVGPFKTQK